MGPRTSTAAVPTAPGRGGRQPDALGPPEVLGVPLLPPSIATRSAARVRAGLARLYHATAPPPARVLEAALGGLDPAALAALCILDIPDRLHGPTTVVQLAHDLDADPARLDRLLRYATTRGWVGLDRRGRIRATRVTAFLRRDHPGGWRAWVEFVAGAEVTAALAALDAGLQADGDAFAAANGAAFFAWMQATPGRHVVFDAAMAAGGRMHGLLLARTLDWSDRRRVCDVGGGNGAALAVLLAHQPHLEGVLLDLPEVVARAPSRRGLTPVPGDAFVSVPHGCDTYLLVNVLHDWGDEDALVLLRRTAEAAAAAPPDAVEPRIVVIESETHPRPRDGLATRADLLMLALTPGGRERTTVQLAALAKHAGLVLRRTYRLASGDVAHVFQAGAPSPGA
jgi:2,7-dihydroxy-5-methyl-1-naphthoate 7-O-methyltransferase